MFYFFTFYSNNDYNCSYYLPGPVGYRAAFPFFIQLCDPQIQCFPDRVLSGKGAFFVTLRKLELTASMLLVVYITFRPLSSRLEHYSLLFSYCFASSLKCSTTLGFQCIRVVNSSHGNFEHKPQNRALCFFTQA